MSHSLSVWKRWKLLRNFCYIHTYLSDYSNKINVHVPQKSGKKKSTSIEFGISSENVLKPDVKRKRQNESLSEDLNEPEYVECSSEFNLFH